MGPLMKKWDVRGDIVGSSWRLDPRKSFASGSMFAINEIISFYSTCETRCTW